VFFFTWVEVVVALLVSRNKTQNKEPKRTITIKPQNICELDEEDEEDVQRDEKICNKISCGWREQGSLYLIISSFLVSGR
jgi:hypothetical protein